MQVSAELCRSMQVYATFKKNMCITLHIMPDYAELCKIIEHRRVAKKTDNYDILQKSAYYAELCQPNKLFGLHNSA